MLEILKYLNKILFFKFKFGVSAILNKKKNKNALEKTGVISPEWAYTAKLEKYESTQNTFFDLY